MSDLHPKPPDQCQEAFIGQHIAPDVQISQSALSTKRLPKLPAKFADFVAWRGLSGF